MEGSSPIPKSFLIFLAFTSSIIINPTFAGRTVAGKTSAATAFIRTSCSCTTYPKLCFTSLSSHSNAIQSDPKLLAHAALSITLKSTRSTSEAMVNLSKIHGLKPSESASMRDCVEMLSNSVEQLQESLGAMGRLKGLDFKLAMSDMQTWVSAALTDDNTCTDGFTGKPAGNVKTAVRGQIVKVVHLTSNALALINSYAALHG